MQTLVRSMPDLHKTLILAHARSINHGVASGNKEESSKPNRIVIRTGSNNEEEWVVEELAMATEHAPLRHRQKLLKASAENTANVGAQRKRQKKDA